MIIALFWILLSSLSLSMENTHIDMNTQLDMPTSLVHKESSSSFSVPQKILVPIIITSACTMLPVSIALSIKGSRKFTHNIGAEIYFGWICGTAASVAESAYPKWDLIREIGLWKPNSRKESILQSVKVSGYFTIGMLAGIWVLQTTHVLFEPYLKTGVYPMEICNFLENFNATWSFCKLEESIRHFYNRASCCWEKKNETTSEETLSLNGDHEEAPDYFLEIMSGIGGFIGTCSCFYNYPLGVKNTIETLSWLGCRSVLFKSILGHSSGISALAIGMIFRGKGAYAVTHKAILSAKRAIKAHKEQGESLWPSVSSVAKQGIILSLCVGAALPSTFLSISNLPQGEWGSIALTGLNFIAGVVMSHWLMDEVVTGACNFLSRCWSKKKFSR